MSKVSDSITRRFFEESDSGAGPAVVDNVNENIINFDAEYTKIMEKFVERKIVAT